MPLSRALLVPAALLLAVWWSNPAQARVERRAWTTEDTWARAKPSGFGSSIGRVPEDTELEVLEEGENWTRVKDGDEEGWIRTSSLRFETVPAEPDDPEPAEPMTPALVLPPEPPRQALRIPRTPAVLPSAPVLVSSVPTSGSRSRMPSGRWRESPRVLGLRERPSFGARLHASIARSTRVRVLQSDSGWALVEDGRGHRGWIVEAALQRPLQR